MLVKVGLHALCSTDQFALFIARQAAFYLQGREL